MSRSTETLSALTFRLAQRRYALALDRTSGVRDLGSVRRIPGAPGGWYGLIDWNGRVLNVVDLPLLLDDRGVEKARSIVRLRAPLGDLALFVPAHLGLAELSPPREIAAGARYTSLGPGPGSLHWIDIDALLVETAGVATR